MSRSATLTHILTPVDFSDASREAARFALGIARRIGAGLTLVHVDQLPSFSERFGERVAADLWESYVRDRNAALHRELEQFARSLGGEHVGTALARDERVAGIVRQAAELPADLILMAPHGAGQSMRFLLGDVPLEVAASAPCPVMVTRHSPSFPLPTAAAFERLLIATSGHDSHLNIASLVAALAVPKAAIDLLHVFETDESVAGPQLAVVFPEPMRLRKGEVRARLEQVAKELGRAGFKTSMHMESGNAAAILVDRLATSAHDLAIVSASARRQPGPVAERLLRHSPVPVVVVR